jgi:hypothetical protein
MFFRQPAKLAFIDSTAPMSWYTTSAGANHKAMKSGSINANMMSTVSSMVTPKRAIWSGEAPPNIENMPTPVTIDATNTIATSPTRYSTPTVASVPNRWLNPANARLKLKVPSSASRLASINPPVNTGPSTQVAMVPMIGRKASTMRIRPRTTMIPIHVPAAARKIDQASVIQVQPLPAGTPRPAGRKSPRGTTASSATCARGAAYGLVLM